MNAKLFTLMAAILLWALALAGCGLQQQSQAQADVEEIEKRLEKQMEEIEKRLEEAEKRTEKERAAEERGAESAQGESENAPTETVLRIDGDRQTEFSGSCTVGNQQEKTISGRAPQSFEYELNGQRLKCEIRNESGGQMEVVLEAGNDHSVQRTNAQGATIRLTYSESGISSSTVSSSGGGAQASSSSSQTSGSSSSQTQVVVSD